MGGTEEGDKEGRINKTKNSQKEQRGKGMLTLAIHGNTQPQTTSILKLT